MFARDKTWSGQQLFPSPWLSTQKGGPQSLSRHGTGALDPAMCMGMVTIRFIVVLVAEGLIIEQREKP